MRCNFSLSSIHASRAHCVFGKVTNLSRIEKMFKRIQCNHKEDEINVKEVKNCEKC